MDSASFEFRLLSESADLSSFNCKDDDLNHFLWDDAVPYMTELMAVTYLLVDSKENRIIAYFSLLNDKVSYDADNKSIWKKLSKGITYKKRRRNYPSVKIGRFAVSKNYEGKGLGRGLLNFIKIFFTQSNKTGCRFLTVDAYADAVGFYQKNGFDFFTKKDEGKSTRLMFFDLKPFKDALNNKK